VHFGNDAERSGVVSSVHAFAHRISELVCRILLVVIAVCLVAYSKDRGYLKTKTSSIRWFRGNRASSLTIGVLVAWHRILSGTLFPVFSEWFTGSRISVGAAIFNKVNIPLGCCWLFLTGVGRCGVAEDFRWRVAAEFSVANRDRPLGGRLHLPGRAGFLCAGFAFVEHVCGCNDWRGV